MEEKLQWGWEVASLLPMILHVIAASVRSLVHWQIRLDSTVCVFVI